MEIKMELDEWVGWILDILTHRKQSSFSEKQLPIKDSKLNKQFHCIRNCLSQHSQFFHNNPVTDRLLFPFVKLFPSKGLQTFEIFLIFCSHWLQPLYSSFPSLPFSVSNFIEASLESKDPFLLHIVKQTSLISQLFDSLLCLFTDLLSRETWLRLFDFFFCFSEFPELLFLTIPAFIILLKQDLYAFANKHSLPNEPKEEPSPDSHEDKDAHDQQLESLTRQIQLATQMHDLRLTSDFNQSLLVFTDAFLAKVRLLPATQIIKELQKLLRRCYTRSDSELKYSPLTEQHSTALHYPIFNFTSRLII
jgi:hypothetical protein